MIKYTRLNIKLHLNNINTVKISPNIQQIIKINNKNNGITF